jgi:hypothetical protein
MKKNQEYRRPRHPKFGHLQHCDVADKVRYKDHRMATDYLHHIKAKAAKEMAEHGFTNHNEKRSYKCNSCKGWHLTSWETPASKFELVA